MRPPKLRIGPAKLLAVLLVIAALCGRLETAAGIEPALVLEGHKGEALCVAFSPDGKTLATGGDDGTVRLWDAESGKEKFALDAAPVGAPGPIRTFAVAFGGADGKTLLASVAWDEMKLDGDHWKGGAGGVRAWDLESKKVRYTIDAHWAPLMALTPDGKTIATSCGYRSNNCDITLWDAESGKKLGALDHREQHERVLSFSPDGKRLAVGTFEGAVELWDRASQKLLVSFWASKTQPRVDDLAFAPDGKTLAVSTSSSSTSLKLFEVEDVEEIVLRDTSWYSCGDGVRGCLKYSPDGKVLALGDGGAVRLLSPWSGACTRKTAYQRGRIVSIAISPDGKLVATAGGVGKVTIWNLDDD